MCIIESSILDMTSTIGFYIVKLLAIALISTYYFILGSIMSITINRFTPRRDVKQMSTLRLFIEILLSFIAIGIGYYFIRKIVRIVPFPLEGLYDFEKTRLKEMSGGIIVSYVVFTYQQKLAERLLEFASRMNGFAHNS